MRRSVISILAGTTAACLLLAVLLQAQTLTTPQRDRVVPTITTAPSSCNYSATLSVLPSQSQVNVGETLVVTCSLSVSEGCSFLIYDLSLQQRGDDAPVLMYVSPPTHTVGPPVGSPFSYQLTAVSTGTVILRGQAYGERNCGYGYSWSYICGRPEPVQVRQWLYRIRLPVIYRGQ
jgi:hypothetical protein